MTRHLSYRLEFSIRRLLCCRSINAKICFRTLIRSIQELKVILQRADSSIFVAIRIAGMSFVVLYWLFHFSIPVGDDNQM